MQGNAENIWFDWRDMKGDIQTIHFQIVATPLLCQKQNNGGEFMIEVKNISKDFVSQKKYPGLKRVVKGLFTNEKYLER